MKPRAWTTNIQWKYIGNDGNRGSFSQPHLRHHFAVQIWSLSIIREKTTLQVQDRI